MVNPCVLLGTFLILYSSLWPIATCNTEIVTFYIAHESDTPIPFNPPWQILSYAANQIRWELHPAPLHSIPKEICEPLTLSPPCPHELWLTLDLAESPWLRYSRFTLRLSWPASSPGAFFLDVFSPEELSRKLSTVRGADASSVLQKNKIVYGDGSRRRYARIRVVHTAVLTPTVSSAAPQREPIAFKVILEHLYLGFLPASVLPVVLFLLPVISLAFLAVSHIYRHMTVVARRAQGELRQGVKGE